MQDYWPFWTVVLVKTLESHLYCKEIKPVNPKGTQSWIFIGRTDAEAEAPIFWPPDEKNWLAGKDPDAGKDWRQEEKGMTEDNHWLDGHVFEQALGLGDGQGSLVCCTPWAGKDWTELNGTVSNYWNKLFLFTYRFLWILWKYFVVAVKSLSCDQLFVARLISQCLLKLMFTELVIASNHLILCHPLLLSSVFPHIKVFSSELTLSIRRPKYWSLSFSNSPSSEYSRLIFFRIDWFDFLTAQGNLKSLHQQHHNSKGSILQHLALLWSNSHICTWLLEKILGGPI